MTEAYAQRPRRKRQAAAKKRAAARQEDLVLGSRTAHRLLDASNAATAALEADAQFSKLPAYDLPYFEKQTRLEHEQYLARLMTAAGRGLVEALTDLLNADQVWDSIASSERTLGQALATAPDPFRVRMELAELLTQHLPELLLTLGYHPPPPAEEWTDLVQNSVQNVLSAGEETESIVRNSAKARQELIFFTWRLRALVEHAEASLARDESGKDSQPGAVRHHLRGTLSAARRRAIPAALAAGVGAAVAGIGGGPPAMGIAFLSGSAASLFKSATEAVATAWLADGTQRDGLAMSTIWAVRADVQTLDECIELMESATGNNIEAYRFIIRRGIFQTLEDAADCPLPVRDVLWKWSQAQLSILGQRPFPADKAHQLADLARNALRDSC